MIVEAKSINLSSGEASLGKCTSKLSASVKSSYKPAAAFLILPHA